MDSKSQQKVSWISIVKVLILGAIVWWVVARFPKNDWDLLVQQPKNWWLLLLAVILVIFANLISFWRWHRLLLALQVPISLFETIRLGFLGVAFNTVSAGSVGGDLFKAIAAANKSKDRKTEVITSVLVDRAIGMLGLVMVAAISTSLAGNLSTQLAGIRNAAWALSVIGIVGILSVVILGKALPLDWLKKIPLAGDKIYKIAQACLIFQNRPELALAMIAKSLCVHSLATTALWIISSALYSDAAIQPTVSEHFLAIPPALLAGTLPITPGGIGLQEVWIDLLFKQIPSVSSQFSGLIVATMYRAVTLIVALIGGLIYLASRPEVRKLHSEVDSVNSLQDIQR
ncbi:MAG: lysylphosphatidylglycerol synthase transmembrane domain-containing protein [Pirellula sp.]